MRESLEWDAGLLDLLWRRLTALRADLVRDELRAKPFLKRVHAAQLQSARNLVHYLALRRHDLRGLQDGLAAVGLSSLGRAESHVLATVDSVLGILRRLLRKATRAPRGGSHVNFQEGRSLLKSHTEQLLGRKPAPRFVRIMVTMPSEAASQPELVEQLLDAGMNCMRINCAHDTPADWACMVDNLRLAEAKLGRNCAVIGDLAGPKLRTGPIEAGPALVKWKPKRDALGKVTEPARVCLAPAGQGMSAREAAQPTLPVPAAWLAGLRVGDVLHFTDVRGKKRTLAIVERDATACWGESKKAAILQPGAVLRRVRPSDPSARRRFRFDEVILGDIPAMEQPILLKVGDALVLTRSIEAGRPAVIDRQGRIRRPARIGCAAAEIFDDVRPGEPIWFDDGKIGGVIESKHRDRLKIRVSHARPKGERLWADKGINLPASRLRLPPLTSKDIRDLAFLAERADLVGYSFVQSPKDVGALQAALRRLRAERIGIVLKVETRRAFERLPDLLLAAMRGKAVGVMIARGDLAVECGYERLAEVQEEILWVCEAAHVPVIWATQVLESLARDGLPSRAEITDAAMGVRAECVMLNKGPQLVAAVRALNNILRRMEAHQNKKSAMLRSLSLAREFNPV